MMERMNSRPFLLLLLVFFISCHEQESPSILNVAEGRIERVESFPSKFVKARNLDIWLPPGYNPNETYAVLYMHDGQMLYDSTTTWNKQEWQVDETLARLIAAKKIPPCIVVGVWNADEDRHPDYFPQQPFESLPQAFRDSLVNDIKRGETTPLFVKPPQSDAYLKFLVEEVKPYIDATYATKPERCAYLYCRFEYGRLDFDVCFLRIP